MVLEMNHEAPTVFMHTQCFIVNDQEVVMGRQRWFEKVIMAWPMHGI